MIVETRLRDGARALVLDLLPGDREALRAAYEELSEEARYHRFLTGVPHLTPALLDHLVDDVDGINHVALALVVLDEENVGTPAGIGRIIRYADRPTAADLAVTVLDEWQGRGVATALVNELLRRRPPGVTQIVTTVAADNPASLALLRRLGPTTETPGETPRLDVVVDLDGEGPDRQVRPVPESPDPGEDAQAD